MRDVDPNLVALVTEVVDPGVASHVAGTATELIGAGVAAAAIGSAAHNFLSKFNTPKEGHAVTLKATGQSGVVKFVHHNGKLNIDWTSGGNSSHSVDEVDRSHFY